MHIFLENLIDKVVGKYKSIRDYKNKYLYLYV